MIESLKDIVASTYRIFNSAQAEGWKMEFRQQGLVQMASLADGEERCLLQLSDKPQIYSVVRYMEAKVSAGVIVMGYEGISAIVKDPFELRYLKVFSGSEYILRGVKHSTYDTPYESLGRPIESAVLHYGNYDSPARIPLIFPRDSAELICGNLASILAKGRITPLNALDCSPHEIYNDVRLWFRSLAAKEHMIRLQNTNGMNNIN